MELTPAGNHRELQRACPIAALRLRGWLASGINLACRQLTGLRSRQRPSERNGGPQNLFDVLRLGLSANGQAMDVRQWRLPGPCGRVHAQEVPNDLYIGRKPGNPPTAAKMTCPITIQPRTNAPRRSAPPNQSATVCMISPLLWVSISLHLPGRARLKGGCNAAPERREKPLPRRRQGGAEQVSRDPLDRLRPKHRVWRRRSLDIRPCIPGWRPS